MSRKHYRSIAAIIRKARYLNDDQRESLADELSDVFKSDNTAFSRQQFLAACVEDDNDT